MPGDFSSCISTMQFWPERGKRIPPMRRGGTLDLKRVCIWRRVKGIFTRSFGFVIPLELLLLLTYKCLSGLLKIFYWIGAECEKMGLVRNLMFEKKEAIAEDIALILQTLWWRAEDIPCAPLGRLFFYVMLLLAASGGFRLRVVKNVKYRYLDRFLFNWYAVPRYKRRASLPLSLCNRTRSGKTLLKKIRRMCMLPFTLVLELLKSPLSQLLVFSLHAFRRINFPVLFVEYDLFCLASLAVARGLWDDAFDPFFDLAENLLRRPPMARGGARLKHPFTLEKGLAREGDLHTFLSQILGNF